MRPFRIGIVCGAFALVAFHATAASAAGPSGALLLGEGFKDGYNFGIGARGGFTLPMSLYLGGTFVYHLGSREGTSSAPDRSPSAPTWVSGTQTSWRPFPRFAPAPFAARRRRSAPARAPSGQVS